MRLNQLRMKAHEAGAKLDNARPYQNSQLNQAAVFPHNFAIFNNNAALPNEKAMQSAPPPPNSTQNPAGAPGVGAALGNPRRAKFLGVTNGSPIR